jgi:hypothetical protein
MAGLTLCETGQPMSPTTFVRPLIAKGVVPVLVDRVDRADSLDRAGWFTCRPFR